jgi:phage N-6-adenine-methyltransferase
MANDLWRTPPEVFNALDREFEFVADMAASEENALCSEFFDEEYDSLLFDWAYHFLVTKTGNACNKYVWLNPPYSDPMPWIKKAAESQKNGLGVVMLLNSDNSVGWFAEALKTVSEIRNIVGYEDECGKFHSGRIAFLDENGNPAKGNNKPQLILVFNPFKIGACVTSYVKKSELYK